MVNRRSLSAKFLLVRCGYTSYLSRDRGRETLTKWSLQVRCRGNRRVYYDVIRLAM